MTGEVRRVQMLCSGVALAAALFGTLKLLVETFAAPATLPGRAAVRVGRVRMVTVTVPIRGIVVFKTLGILLIGPAPYPYPSPIQIILQVHLLLFDPMRRGGLLHRWHGWVEAVNRKTRVDIT